MSFCNHSLKIVKKPFEGAPALRPSAGAATFAWADARSTKWCARREVRRAYLVLGALSLALCTLGQAAPSELGSDAQVWLQQSAAEKAAYLDGICTGLQAAGHVSGETQCGGVVSAAQLRSKQGLRANLRLCGIRFGGATAKGRTLPNGTQVLDAFYADAAHSDVPVILAIEQYNDRVCHESNVGGRLAAAQARRKCARQLINMVDASPQARAAQQAVCDKLR